jgi:hypothetical protein
VTYGGGPFCAAGTSWLVEASAETLRHADLAAAYGRHEEAASARLEATSILEEALSYCTAEAECAHDPELHGGLGLAMHSRLLACGLAHKVAVAQAEEAAGVEEAASQPRFQNKPGASETGEMPFAIPPDLWVSRRAARESRSLR